MPRKKRFRRKYWLVESYTDTSQLQSSLNRLEQEAYIIYKIESITTRTRIPGLMTTQMNPQTGLAETVKAGSDQEYDTVTWYVVAYRERGNQ